VKREAFLELVREALDALPPQFSERLENIAVVVEDFPPREREGDDLLLGVFEGTPRTEESFFDAAPGPARVVLFQKNIEAVARETAREEGRPVDAIIREEVRLTVLHELGHYFGLDEDALEDV
jgi:predicted Zn-dependent protease with MMP-like domain